jgi:hypothetical protein
MCHCNMCIAEQGVLKGEVVNLKSTEEPKRVMRKAEIKYSLETPR